MADNLIEATCAGGVDTRKDLHVDALVDQNNKVLGTQYLSATRQGPADAGVDDSFGAFKRIGVECTGTCGLGLLRYFQNAGLDVLEVSAPDRMELRKRGKSDTNDAECAPHAAFSGIRTVTSKTRDGMIESLRVLKFAEKQRYRPEESLSKLSNLLLSLLRMNYVNSSEISRACSSSGLVDPVDLMPVNTTTLQTFIALH